jgi:hypothetical protein
VEEDIAYDVIEDVEDVAGIRAQRLVRVARFQGCAALAEGVQGVQEVAGIRAQRLVRVARFQGCAALAEGVEDNKCIVPRFHRTPRSSLLDNHYRPVVEYTLMLCSCFGHDLQQSVLEQDLFDPQLQESAYYAYRCINLIY